MNSRGKHALHSTANSPKKQRRVTFSGRTTPDGTPLEEHHTATAEQSLPEEASASEVELHTTSDEASPYEARSAS